MAFYGVSGESRHAGGVIWRRGWDSDCVQLLKTKNLRAFRFLPIRQNRSKAEMDARIAHAAPYTQRTWQAAFEQALSAGARRQPNATRVVIADRNGQPDLGVYGGSKRAATSNRRKLE